MCEGRAVPAQGTGDLQALEGLNGSTAGPECPLPGIGERADAGRPVSNRLGRQGPGAQTQPLTAAGPQWCRGSQRWPGGQRKQTTSSGLLGVESVLLGTEKGLEGEHIRRGAAPGLPTHAQPLCSSAEGGCADWGCVLRPQSPASGQPGSPGGAATHPGLPLPLCDAQHGIRPYRPTARVLGGITGPRLAVHPLPSPFSQFSRALCPSRASVGSQRLGVPPLPAQSSLKPCPDPWSLPAWVSAGRSPLFREPTFW